MIGEFVALFGANLVLLSAIGVNRLTDTSLGFTPS